MSTNIISLPINVLPINRGGTGASSFTTNKLIYKNSTALASASLLNYNGSSLVINETFSVAQKLYVTGDVLTITGDSFPVVSRIAGSTYTALGYTFSYVVIPYIEDNQGLRAYAVGNTTGDITDPNDSSTYTNRVTWSAVPNASGYLIFVTDTFHPYSQNAYVDVGNVLTWDDTDTYSQPVPDISGGNFYGSCAYFRGANTIEGALTINQEPDGPDTRRLIDLYDYLGQSLGGFNHNGSLTLATLASSLINNAIYRLGSGISSDRIVWQNDAGTILQISPVGLTTANRVIVSSATGYVATSSLSVASSLFTVTLPLIVSGTTTYLKLPSLSTTNRNALTGSNGQMVYDSTLNQFYFYENSAWKPLPGSGTYTPTLTNVANLDASTAYSCQYIRAGAVVTVSGRVDVDPTLTATSTQLGISLPIASNIANANECAGTAFASGIAAQGAAILGDATNDRAQLQFISADLTNQAMYFTFTYRII